MTIRCKEFWVFFSRDIFARMEVFPCSIQESWKSLYNMVESIKLFENDIKSVLVCQFCRSRIVFPWTFSHNIFASDIVDAPCRKRTKINALLSFVTDDHTQREISIFHWVCPIFSSLRNIFNFLFPKVNWRAISNGVGATDQKPLSLALNLECGNFGSFSKDTFFFPRKFLKLRCSFISAWYHIKYLLRSPISSALHFRI